MVLLDTIIPEDVSSVIKIKKDTPRLPFLNNGKYGSIVYSLYETSSLEDHVELLNVAMKFWFKRGMPKDLLEALFYTIFEHELVYDETLDAWTEQELSIECFQKATIRLNNTIYQIQDLLNSKGE